MLVPADPAAPPDELDAPALPPEELTALAVSSSSPPGNTATRLARALYFFVFLSLLFRVFVVQGIPPQT